MLEPLLRFGPCRNPSACGISPGRGEVRFWGDCLVFRGVWKRYKEKSIYRESWYYSIVFD